MVSVLSSVCSNFMRITIWTTSPKLATVFTFKLVLVVYFFYVWTKFSWAIEFQLTHSTLQVVVLYVIFYLKDVLEVCIAFLSKHIFMNSTVSLKEYQKLPRMWISFQQNFAFVRACVRNDSVSIFSIWLSAKNLVINKQTQNLNRFEYSRKNIWYIWIWMDGLPDSLLV